MITASAPTAINTAAPITPDYLLILPGEKPAPLFGTDAAMLERLSQSPPGTVTVKLTNAEPTPAESFWERLVNRKHLVPRCVQTAGPQPLSERQRATLDAIQSHIDQHGHAPTQAELSAAMGTSPSCSRTHLKALERKGWVRLNPGHRGIEILNRVEEQEVPA